MCLNKTTRFNYQIAKEDITCYKYVKVSEGGKITSSFRGYDYGRFGDKQPTVKIRAKFIQGRTEHLVNTYGIREGYHTFIQKPKKYSIDYYFAEFNREVMVECIIPKGTRYTKGGINSRIDTDGYVSENIIIKKVCRDDDQCFPVAPNLNVYVEH